MSELPTYVLDRLFDAPRELVWRTWTDPDLLPRWYGPRVETIIHKLELKPGGLLLVEMRWDGGARFERIEYLDVVPPERLVWLQAMADRDWNVVANPIMPDWPRRLHTTVTFAAEGDKTRLKLTWVPHEASAAEIACFAGAIEGLDKGWGSGMDLLAELLAELQA